MIFNFRKHNTDLYNTLLALSRSIFFYNKVKLSDSFETRIYLMLFHFSIFLMISKKKGRKFDQKSYDSLFYTIENNLRELGFGDVSVNNKMKQLNKQLYDILLKFNVSENDKFKINEKLVLKYFKELSDLKSPNFIDFKSYFVDFYDFCFELSLDNMIREAIKFKDKYGSSKT